jgi:hypothetical protein
VFREGLNTGRCVAGGREDGCYLKTAPHVAGPRHRQSGTAHTPGARGSASRPRVTTRQSRQASRATARMATAPSTSPSGRASVRCARWLALTSMARTRSGAWRTKSTSRPAWVPEELERRRLRLPRGPGERLVEDGGFEHRALLGLHLPASRPGQGTVRQVEPVVLDKPAGDRRQERAQEDDLVRDRQVEGFASDCSSDRGLRQR